MQGRKDEIAEAVSDRRVMQSIRSSAHPSSTHQTLRNQEEQDGRFPQAQVKSGAKPRGKTWWNLGKIMKGSVGGSWQEKGGSQVSIMQGLEWVREETR